MVVDATVAIGDDVDATLTSVDDADDDAVRKS